MDQSHEWPTGRRRRKAGSEEKGATAEPSPDLGGDDEGARKRSELWDSEPESSKWLADGHIASADRKIPWRIQGWLAETGTSVWFGAGSTGKTQLMLWMAAMIASRPEDRHEQIWLGGHINGTGHVLILTAEDTREQIMKRLKDVVTHSMDQDEGARRRTFKRLHVMPFLSMSEREFKHPNPSLMQQANDRVWGPSDVMLEVRRFVWEWNRQHPEEDDRIVGVVMDSATSMSGFDSLDAQATTNFFFYLGRLCERLRIFWAVIGHTPKTTSISRLTARETATSRLRGVAMWTTAPRLTVEVRLAQDWRERGKIHPEAPELRAWLGGRVKREDLLVVYVAKANLQNARREERYLLRLRQGAFIDVTDRPDEVLRSGILDQDDGAAAGAAADTAAGVAAEREASSTAGARRPRRGRPRRTEADFAPGTELVLELLEATYPEPVAGTRVSANLLMGALVGMRRVEKRAALVTSASGGGTLPARLGAINWHLDRLEERGVLERRDRFYYLSGAGADPL